MNSFLHSASGYAQLFWPAKNALLWRDKTQVRAELFSVERLEQHAASLATEQPFIKPVALMVFVISCRTVWRSVLLTPVLPASIY